MKLTSRWALPVLAATASVALVTSNPAAGAQAATAQTARPAAGIMTTVAGGPGGPGPATGVGISVCAVKFAHGALYLSGNGMVRRVDPRTGQLTTRVADWSKVTANPYDIYSNSDPCGITVDSAGNLLEAAGTQIKVIAARSGHFYGRAMAAGHIYVVVNRSGVQRAYGTPSGNGRPAIAAELSQANDVELDHAGNVIVTDAGVAGGRDYPPSGAQVRVVAERTGRFYGQKMTAGDIHTVAGSRYKSATRSTLATRTWLGLTIGTVRTDRSGNLVVTVDNKYISSELSSAAAVQVVAVRTGRFYGRRMIAGHMYSIAGNGTNGHPSGNGGPATKAGLDCAASVALDHNGNVIIADCNQVRVVAEHSARFYGRRMTSGGIYAIAGLGQVGDSGDGGPAARAAVNAEGVTVDNVGNVVVSEVGLTRLIATRNGRFYGKQMRAAYIYLIAGTHAGLFGSSGDGGPATRAEVGPSSVAEDRAGDLAIADYFSGAVRFVPTTSGTFFGRKMSKQHIYAVARTIYSNSGAPHVGIAFDKDGNVLTANGGLIQVVPARNGTFYGQPMTVGNVYTIAPLDGEGGGVAVDSHGNVLMADAFGNVVLVLAASSGTFYGQPMTAGNVYTIAGTGQPGDTGDGGPATAAQLYAPVSVAADRHDNVLIADGGDGVRVVAGASGTFFGRRMIAGDIYTIARRLNPYSTELAVDGHGNVVSAAGNVRVIAAGTGTFYGVRMRVGHVYVIAGYGRRTVYPGERNPATRAALGDATGVAIGRSGTVLVADFLTLRVWSLAG